MFGGVGLAETDSGRIGYMHANDTKGDTAMGGIIGPRHLPGSMRGSSGLYQGVLFYDRDSLEQPELCRMAFERDVAQVAIEARDPIEAKIRLLRNLSPDRPDAGRPRVSARAGRGSTGVSGLTRRKVSQESVTQPISEADPREAPSTVTGLALSRVRRTRRRVARSRSRSRSRPVTWRAHPCVQCPPCCVGAARNGQSGRFPSGGLV